MYSLIGAFFLKSPASMWLAYEKICGLSSYFSRVAKGSFVRAASKLVGGAAAAQILMLLSLPVLTRLYSPEAFGLLAIYVSSITIVSVAACFRLEFAILLPDNDIEAANVLSLALVASVVVSSLIAIFVFLAGPMIFSAASSPEIIPYLWLIPLGVWGLSSYGAVQFWVTRKQRFGAVARTRLTQAAMGTGVQIGFGWMAITPFGLLLGHLIMGGSGVLALSLNALRNDLAALKAVSLAGMRRALSTYRRYPQYSAWEALVNNAAIYFPVLIIASLVDNQAGYLFLALRVLGAPISLVGGAVAQVFLARAPTAHKDANLNQLAHRVLLGLTKTGVVPLVILGCVAPSLFEVVFGREWRYAGELVAWLTPMFVMSLLSWPISMVMHVCMRQREQFALTILHFLMRVIATILGYSIDPNLAVIFYALSGFVFHFGAVAVFMRVAGIEKNLCGWLYFSIAMFSFGGIVAGSAINWALFRMQF